MCRYENAGAIYFNEYKKINILNDNKLPKILNDKF